jgi:hypothetical protein
MTKFLHRGDKYSEINNEANNVIGMAIAMEIKSIINVEAIIPPIPKAAVPAKNSSLLPGFHRSTKIN